MAETAELTLIIRAQNLADIELAKIRAGMEKITATARVVAADVAAAFKRIGSRIARQFGNVAQDILSGSSLTQSLTTVGITAAGALVEGLMAHLIPSLLARLGATAVFAPLAAALTTEGATLGGVLSAAIGIGMAALPFVLAAAAVAALVYLIANPEARGKVRDFVLMVIGKIGDGMRALPKFLLDIFIGAWNFVTQDIPRAAGKIVEAIIGGLASLPGKVADVIRQAFTNLKIDIGPFHIRSTGVTIDLPDLGPAGASKYGSVIPGHASGGWVGLHGPELGWLGEKGPEFVIPNSQSGGGGPSGVMLQGVSEDDLLAMIDRKMYFKLQRAVPTSGRV